jgi:DNA-binding transcriptional regulator YbjK
LTARPGGRARGELRRRAILEAALRLLGREGGGSVTHRAVAKEAGVPLAATTYYFDSKDSLLREAFALCMTEDVADLAREPFLPPGHPVTIDAVAERITRLMATRLADERHTQLIQYELGLEAARRPELQPMARAWTAAYAGVAAPALAALGSTQPETDGWILVTSLEGIELEALASGETDPMATLLPCVKRLLTALVATA